MTLEQLENLPNNFTTAQDALMYALHLAIIAPTDEHSAKAVYTCCEVVNAFKMTSAEIEYCKQTVDLAHASEI